MINNKQALIPELRFPEFEGEWVLNKLEQVALKVGSGSTPLGGSSSYLRSGIPFIRSQNVNNDKLIMDDVVYISQITHESMKGSSTQNGDVLLNITGASIGRSCVIPPGTPEANVNQHVCIIRITQDNSPCFLQAILASNKGQKQIQQGQAGGGREGLNFDSIRRFKIHFPSLNEQQKIADFLSSVDSKLELLREKKQQLEAYKKGVMQLIFSQQVRFKQDDGSDFPDWVTRKVGELLKIGSGKDYKHLPYGDIPVYGTGGYMLSVKDYLYDGESVCIGRKGTIDKPYFLKGRFWTVDTLFYTHSFNKCLPKFIYYIFTQINWLLYNEASGVPSLSKNTIEKIMVTVPQDYEEQQKIADFLTSLDNKISKVAEQLSEAEQFKQGLLQKMFV